jgi:hypothetical protein
MQLCCQINRQWDNDAMSNACSSSSGVQCVDLDYSTTRVRYIELTISLTTGVTANRLALVAQE